MKTILIIEDDIVFSRSISNWLVKKGMKTECVATLANARKAIGQKEFDLILADLRLPDGNSTSLLKWMNEKYYSIPFLIMTNYGQVENAVTTMQLGAINYLCKPVQPDNLLALITEILDKNDNEQEFYRGESPKAFVKSSGDSNFSAYRSSDFIILKKFSIIELSRQFPFLDIL